MGARFIKHIKLVFLALAFYPAFGFADLSYDGSLTILEGIVEPVAVEFEMRTGMRFRKMEGAGASIGYLRAMKGEVALGGVARPLSAAEKAERPYHVVIGFDALAVFVHQSNLLKDISKAQLRAVLEGNIKNWKELGLQDRPIQVVTEFKNSGRATLQFVKDAILGTARYGPEKEVNTPHECAQYVASNPNALAVISIVNSQPGLKLVSLNGIKPERENVRSSAYELARPLLLVSRKIPTGEVRTFIDFLFSYRGQRVVERRFVPVK
ncbi:MAG TPA: substrate-binding domain-containing protein [Bdellovibrionota bacterium]|nr:substrate-binding domain-containing protein [Bdellovibrionota bacterium]